MEALLRFIEAIRKDGGPPVEPNTLLFKHRILDSLNVLNLIGYVEEHIARQLEDQEVIMSNFESARRIIDHFFQGRD
jgi:acyl carrier protein